MTTTTDRTAPVTPGEAAPAFTLPAAHGDHLPPGYAAEATTYR
jgi:hypothetical protein